jgi:hypothetical protein
MTLPTVVPSCLLFVLCFSFYKEVYAYCRPSVVIMMMIMIMMIIIIIIVVTVANLIPTSGSDSPLTIPVFVLFRHSPTYAVKKKSKKWHC